MNRTLLAIGDEKDFDSYMKLYRMRRLFKKHKFSFATTDYDSILTNDFPAIKTKTLVIFLFFPFEYWDRHIEPKRYAGAYGNKLFYSKLKKFWKTVDNKLRRHYKDKKIFFVNAPEDIPAERDKRATKQALSKAGIETPRSYRKADVRRIVKLLGKGRKFFIKVRYGSMGKGITYLEKGLWKTNFGFRKKTLLNRHSDYGWKFREVTGNRAFLKQLLEEDVIVEEAVPRWLVRGKHFDLRCLLFFGKILYMYPRSNTTKNITTNVSQGANSETMTFLKEIKKEVIRKAERTAVRAAKALGLNFAGVDIILDPCKQAPIVIEINAFPGFPKMRRFNLARYLIKEIGERKWR